MLREKSSKHGDVKKAIKLVLNQSIINYKGIKYLNIVVEKAYIYKYLVFLV
jgi:hypothetical protein